MLSRRTLERVADPKADFWLVQAVGLLVGSVGLGLAQSFLREGDVPAELRTVAIASAAGLALVESSSSATVEIRPVYLVDAVVQVATVAAWLRESQVN